MVRADAKGQGRTLALYMAGQGGWFLGVGLQMVLFPWLVAVVLHAPAGLVGIAQMALMAPSLLFMLWGGAIADRSDCRAILLRLHVLGVLPPLAMAVALSAGATDYGVLIAFGLTMGTFAAFALPARDALLARIAGGRIQQAVGLATFTQFGCQLAGMMLASLAALFGAVPLMLVHAAAIGLGGLAVLRLPVQPPLAVARRGTRLEEIRDGLRVVWRSEALRPVVATMFAVGVLYIGAHLVALPLIVRDVYRGGVDGIALVNVCFWGGTLVSILALIRIGPLRRPGRAFTLAVSGGAFVLLAISQPMPFVLLLALCAVWGLGAGVVMTLGRAIVQLEAPASHRGRALSVYQLGFMGGAPFGSLLVGQLAGWLGPNAAMVPPALAMFGFLALLIGRTRLWHLRAVTAPVPG